MEKSNREKALRELDDTQPDFRAAAIVYAILTLADAVEKLVPPSSEMRDYDGEGRPR